VQPYVAILISASVTLVAGLIAVAYNICISRKHRNIIAVMQLARDFYQDSAFIEHRATSWSILRTLNEDECDYQKIVATLVSEDEKSQKKNAFIALNRTAAFYMSVRNLVQWQEVNIPMLRDLFGYNYNVFWNPVRERIQRHSSHPKDKELFSAIPELEDNWNSPRRHFSFCFPRKKYIARGQAHL
jgi:hypothetical protein